jgi:hypothetical protein
LISSIIFLGGTLNNQDAGPTLPDGEWIRHVLAMAVLEPIENRCQKIDHQLFYLSRQTNPVTTVADTILEHFRGEIATLLASRYQQRCQADHSVKGHRAAFARLPRDDRFPREGKIFDRFKETNYVFLIEREGDGLPVVNQYQRFTLRCLDPCYES